MRVFNYVKIFGAFVNSSQLIKIKAEPTDRQERKMLEAAQILIDKAWGRRSTYVQAEALKTGEILDLVALKAEFYPKTEGENLLIPLQFVQDYMIRKIAGIQNNTSIHNATECKELKDVFAEYKVELFPSFKGLVLDFINWTAKEGQKPKLLVHALASKAPDAERLVIRFEGISEGAVKFLSAYSSLGLQSGMGFSFEVEAVDPAPERNRKAGKVVAPVGVYVNHNLVVTNEAGVINTGHPPKGEVFNRKPDVQSMERLFYRARGARVSDGANTDI